MRILGIETSCDETAAAVVDDTGHVASSAVASQARVHAAYRGVVPELASRCHIEYMLPTIHTALDLAGIGRDGAGIDALAVTRGPGLVGSLLVGLETAKALAWAWGKPLIAVHHTHGHLASVFCHLPEGQTRVLDIPPEAETQHTARHARWRDENPSATCRPAHIEGAPAFDYPYLGLVVSGGHSSLVEVRAPASIESLGETLDDAPGEAYDKVARFLGLPYPGGPEIDRLAAEGDPEAFDFPRPILHSHGFDFSFSGLKTAVIQAIDEIGGAQAIHDSENALRDVCASFQAAVVDVLLAKARRALDKRDLGRLAVVGGVACNRGLRAEAARRFPHAHLLFPPSALCTDNAAMIAQAAHALEPLDPGQALALDARAGWRLGDAVAS